MSCNDHRDRARSRQSFARILTMGSGTHLCAQNIVNILSTRKLQYWILIIPASDSELSTRAGRVSLRPLPGADMCSGFML